MVRVEAEFQTFFLHFTVLQEDFRVITAESIKACIMESTVDHVEQPHCRFCNEESTSERPLFFPCKCKGSMKFIHQECLQDWIKHSGNSSCTVCGEVIRFEKVYFENATCVEFKFKVAFEAWKWSLIYCFEGMLLGLRYLYWLVGLPLFMGWSCEVCWGILRNGTISWTDTSEFARLVSMWKAGWIELAVFGILLVAFLAMFLGFQQVRLVVVAKTIL